MQEATRRRVTGTREREMNNAWGRRENTWKGRGTPRLRGCSAERVEGGGGGGESRDPDSRILLMDIYVCIRGLMITFITNPLLRSCAILSRFFSLRINSPISILFPLSYLSSRSKASKLTAFDFGANRCKNENYY